MRLLSFTYLSHAIAAIVTASHRSAKLCFCPELQLGFEKV